MKGESDESALEPVVDRVRKQRGDVRVDLRLVVRVDDVEQAARIVDEAAAIGQIAHEADTRPARGRHVLIHGAHPARIRKAHEILDLDLQSAFRDRRRNRIARGLRRNDHGAQRDRQPEEQWHQLAHADLPAILHPTAHKPRGGDFNNSSITVHHSSFAPKRMMRGGMMVVGKPNELPEV